MEAAVSTAMEASTRSSTVETATAEASTTAVKTAAATTAAVTSAAMLGKDRLRRTNEGKRNKSGEKNFQQGGFAHFSSSKQKRVGVRRVTASTE